MVSHAPQTYHCLISCAVCAGYICCSFQNWATGSMAQSSMSRAQPVSVLHGGVPLRTSPTHSRLSSGRLFSRHGKTRIHTQFLLTFSHLQFWFYSFHNVSSCCIICQYFSNKFSSFFCGFHRVLPAMLWETCSLCTQVITTGDSRLWIRSFPGQDSQ